MKTVKSRKSDDEAKAMASYVARFSSIEDALAFEKAALSASNVHLPPCARGARDHNQRNALYWRWLDVLAEVWS